MLLLLAGSMLIPLFSVMPAYAEVNAGDIYSYELWRVGGDNKNVLDTVIYESGKETAPITDNFAIFPGTEENEVELNVEYDATQSVTGNDLEMVFSFTNVKQYITSGGATEECTGYYFQAISNNTSLVTVGSVKKSEYIFTASTLVDNYARSAEAYSDSYLVLNVPGVSDKSLVGGVAVITVLVTTETKESSDGTIAGNFDNALKKTFTVKIVNDTKDGDIEIKLKQAESPLERDESGNESMSLRSSSAYTNLNIDQIICYDYQTSLSSNTEKLITYYTWSAEVLEGNEFIKISDPSDNSLTSMEVEANAGTKTVKVTPIKPGTARIKITVIPDTRYGGRYKENSKIITVNVTQDIGNLSFTAKPVEPMYGYPAGADNYEVAVELEISDIMLKINGNDPKPLADISGENGMTITTFDVSFSDSTAGLFMDNAAEKISVDGDFSNGEGKYILPGKIYTSMASAGNQYSFKTTVTVTVNIKDIKDEGNLDRSETRYYSQTVIFNLYNANEDGNVFDFKITQTILENKDDGAGNLTLTKSFELIKDNQTVSGEVNKNNAYHKLLEFEVSDVLCYGENSTDSDHPYRYYSYLANETDNFAYISGVTSSNKSVAAVYTTRADGIETTDKTLTFEVKPKAVGTTTIEVNVNYGDGNKKAYKREFTVKVTNIGVFVDDEGEIVKVDLLFGKEHVYDGGEFYLKNDKINAMEVNINKIYVADPEQSSSNYNSELKNYEWEVSISDSNKVDPIISGGNGGILNPPIDYTGNKTSDINLGSDDLKIKYPEWNNLNYTAKYLYFVNENKNICDYAYKEEGTVTTELGSDSVKSFTLNTGWYPSAGTSGKNDTGIIVTITIRSLNSTGEYTGKDATVKFIVYTSEMGGQFMPAIAYDDEKIKIIESRTLKEFDANGDKIFTDVTYTFTGGDIKYMYCLKAAANGANQANEKWFPFYGTEMDISKYIPQTVNSTYRIAIRRADAISDDNNYPSGVRMPLLIPARKTLDNKDKKQYAYENGEILYKGSDEAVTIDYRVGVSGWDKKVLSSGTGNGIQVSPTLNPYGNTVEIRIAAVSDGEDPKFASVSFKIKVPAVSKKPLIKDDGKMKISGFSTKLSWSTGGKMNDSSNWIWITCENGFVLYKNLESTFPGLTKKIINGEEYYLLYLKTAATAKAAESEIVIVPIPTNNYKK